MFLRQLLKSRPIMTKNVSAFFKSRTYLTEKELVAFRKQWDKFTPEERIQIAVNDNNPPCGDVLISKGDYFQQINAVYQARCCYEGAIQMNKDCEDIAKARIAKLDEQGQDKRMEQDQLKKTDRDDEIRINHRVYAGK
jgi:hypothetical protein